jgi:hypothetical protein
MALQRPETMLLLSPPGGSWRYRLLSLRWDLSGEKDRKAGTALAGTRAAAYADCAAQPAARMMSATSRGGPIHPLLRLASLLAFGGAVRSGLKYEGTKLFPKITFP